MAKDRITKLYNKLRKDYPGYLAAWDGVTAASRGNGVIDERTCHLIQLAAAAAVRSEGAVHSHVRRALEAGVAPREIEQAILLATTSIGFPAVVAALSWAGDIIGKPGKAAKKRKA
jgi:alkylhydroperoxidase/carboxymuconolactone decarboxylase family protein YurZ